MCRGNASDAGAVECAHAGAVDADDLLDAFYASHVDAAAISALRLKQRRCEEMAVCAFMIKNQAFDEATPREECYLCYAAALDASHRRPAAISLLEGAVRETPTAFALVLALAKLLFRADDAESAAARCLAIIASADADSSVVAAAYQLAGWISIHGDDHGGAYDVWSRGHAAAPDDDFLRTQHTKRTCWDGGEAAADERAARGLLDDCDRRAFCVCDDDAEAAADGQAGDAARRPVGLEAFVASGPTEAVALFDASQKRRLVFRSRGPVLSERECAAVAAEVESFMRNERGGIWGTVRSSSVKTTDVAVEDIPSLRPWLRTLMETRLAPLLEAAFPRLADGSTLRGAGDLSRVRVHDAFVVRYDAEKDGSLSLPEHRDTSAVSFTIALNKRGADFEGGGTWFEALGPRGTVVDAEIGRAVAFAGPLRHAGYPITTGTRLILVLFLYVEGFAYGGLVAQHNARERPSGDDTAAAAPAAPDAAPDAAPGPAPDAPLVRPSGDGPNGFVVYKQTEQLVQMLARNTTSVLG